ncbi:integrase arm-type DNA-binding domain-containing protein [Sphingomonadaceae bacterium OTU29MARTA1]|nr:integrase arm-type DNA-binding domain-containing protein [Sphingomonadaceae bacterium OTU29MARTA1]
MPRKAKELSALAVANLKPVISPSGSVRTRFMVGGADGLHLRIVGQSRSWILRIMVNGDRRDIGLGGYPGVTLATARKLANEHRDQLARGIDPLADRRAKAEANRIEKAKAWSFQDCADAYITAHRGEWKNPKHAAQWSATLETYAYPVFGSRPVAAIDTHLILAVIEPLWATKTETASRLRGRIEKVLGWAAFRGFRTGENPARWKDHLDHHLPARADVRKVQHHASLHYNQLAQFMADLRKRDGISARALEFAILCASRSGEVREATWAEFDLERRLWTIPTERMKADREHTVPLSDAAICLLKDQLATPRPKDYDGPLYVFHAPRGGAFSDSVFRALFERMGRTGLTQHGFRSTFREWAGETTSHPREVVEHALAHLLADKAEAAYQRGSLLPKRKSLMADWADFCSKLPDPPSSEIETYSTKH